ncbi:MAG: hypothetical protein ACRCW6_00010 [Mycoplasmoidaceae bacterium]
MNDIEKLKEIDKNLKKIEKNSKINIQDYVFKSLFCNEVLNNHEKKILKEAINISMISKRGSFMLLRLLSETIFKRIIPFKKFYKSEDIGKKINSIKKEKEWKIKYCSKKDKKIRKKELEFYNSLLKNLKQENDENTLFDYLEKQTKSNNNFKIKMLDYRTLGRFLFIFETKEFKEKFKKILLNEKWMIEVINAYLNDYNFILYEINYIFNDYVHGNYRDKKKFDKQKEGFVYFMYIFEYFMFYVKILSIIVKKMEINETLNNWNKDTNNGS